MNAQDVLRDVHDPSTHSLKTTGSAAATIFAVVNTSAAGDSVNNIGFATVSVSNPTLYAVVNTSAPGVGNSIVTVANLPLTTQIVGNVTIDSGVITSITNPVALKGNVTISDSKGFIGLVSVSGFANPLAVTQSGTWDEVGINDSGNSITIDGNVGVLGNVTISDSKGYIGLVTVTQASSVRSIAGNVTISDSKGYIGLVTTTLGGAWADPKGYIGLVTITGSLSAAAGNVTLDPGSFTGIKGNITIDSGVITTITNPVAIKGNMTITDSKGFIGLVTLGGGTAWADPKGYIGLVTITGSLAPAAGNVTLDPGSFTGIKGNLTISDSKGFIGLVSVSGFANPMPVSGTFWQATQPVSVVGNVTVSDSKTFIGLVTTQAADPKGYIGLVTVVQSSAVRSIAGNVTLTDSKGYIGLVSIGGGILNTITAVTDITNPVAIKGNITLSDPKGFIGLVTADLDHAWPDPKTYIGLTTTTLGVGTTFIGLVTAWTRNAGTAKTLLNAPISFLSAGSQSTIAVPTNANSIYVTNMLLSSDATVRVSIKSGVTYLSGNASFGITLFPGGGFVYPGSPDSPTWIGLPSGALIIEKLDLTATSAKVGGNVIYFQE